jgi:hypothetical protein
MLLGGGSSCQSCGCVPCGSCTRTCQNPHTGSAFQEVYRGYSFGAVNGLATDGYLTFSGDEDNPAFISGGGPFHQAIGGTFYLSSAQTRFPCSLTVSFWRTLFPADATTDTALSQNTVTFTCLSGQFFLPTVGVTLNPGDIYTFSNAVPLIGGFGGDPRSSIGSAGGFATCDNTQVAVEARIGWSSSERIHVLHGIVRECYEEGSPCATVCSGSPPPSSVYFNVSNATTSAVQGSYVIGRVPNLCTSYYGYVDTGCTKLETLGGIQDIFSINQNVPTVVSADEQNISGYFVWRDGSGVCNVRRFSISRPSSATWSYCGTGSLFSGTGANLFTLGGTTSVGTFDWSVTA